MPVTCRCGQAFTVQNVPMPRRISCHTCGRKLIVVQDGERVTAHEIRALSVEIACPCGQPFTVHAEQFPMKIRCFKCGRRFNVLDTGDIVDPLPGSYDRHDHEMAEAIQDGRLLTEPAAICGGATQELFRAEAVDADRIDLMRELRLIDSCWRAERERSALFRLLGVTVVPSRLLSVVIGSIIIVGGLMLVIFFTRWFAIQRRPDQLLLALLGIAHAVLAVVFGYYVARRLHGRAERYEQEKAEYQQRRLDAIASHDAALTAR